MMTDYLFFVFHKLLVKLRPPGVRNSIVHFSSKVESGSLFLNSEMGKHSFCGYDCEIQNTIIGSFCSIASNVSIGASAHPLSWVSTSPVFYDNRDSIKKKFSRFQREPQNPTIIGHDVWVGKGAFVKQGIQIGTGAVVGMGAVVTKDVEPYSVVAGNPANVIKYRFEESVREGLLRSMWWELPDEDLALLATYIKDPIKFLSNINALERGC